MKPQNPGLLDVLILVAAASAVLACLAFPISSADLWWHLSAARQTVLAGGPVSDTGLAACAGRWINFEWLFQLMMLAAHGAAGLGGLWALKAGFMGASAWLLLKTCALYGAPAAYGAAAAAVWAAASLTRSDIRPELLSVAAFGWLFFRLEGRRLGKPFPNAWAMLALFLVWANAHAGYAYGLALLGLYAAVERLPRAAGGGPGRDSLLRRFAYACVGALAQWQGPAGPLVLWEHARHLGDLSAYLTEWAPLRLSNPWFWPAIAVMTAAAVAAATRLTRGKTALAPLAACVVTAWAATRHARLAPYFLVMAAPSILRWAMEAGVLAREADKRARACCLAAAVFSLGFIFWSGRSFGLGARLFNPRSAPSGAAEFLAAQSETLGARSLYNPWGWGGFLEWRLIWGPEAPAASPYRVFQDGRYVCHDLLPEQAEALQNTEAWQAFLDRHGVGVALVENSPVMAALMPAERWDRAYSDPKALVLVKRPRR